MTTDRYPGLAAAEFGYAVESLCTRILGPSAAGWSLEHQVAAGRTRSDIVARKPGRTMWPNLTAGREVSHIYATKNRHFGNVCLRPHAELTYPVLDLAVSMIRKNAALEYGGKPVANISQRLRRVHRRAPAGADTTAGQSNHVWLGL